MTGPVILVGAGNMGFAMLDGWVASASDRRFFVVEPNAELRARAAQTGAAVFADADSLPADLAPELVFLAVKPQVITEVAPAYGRFAGATFVSIAAGVTVATLQGCVGQDAAIIRCMPNTPAAIGQGMLVSYANAQVSAGARAATDTLLAASGTTGWIDDEALMDAVTAISGSGPGYVFHFIECLEDAAIGLGLPAELARTLAIQTVAGAGQLAQSTDTPPAVLRQQVTSPGGTTAAGLEVLMASLGETLQETATAARDRGVALGKT